MCKVNLSLLIRSSFYCLLLFISSCANMVSPSGGTRDIKPPVLKKIIPADSSRNLPGGSWVFEFDEFIQVKDIAQQLVISPLLSNIPRVRAHKRFLHLDIPDSLLQSNTTYTLHFGDAIQDLHEGNPIQGLQYTFSTGPYLDSLTLKGKVWDAATGKPDTSCFVMLYESGQSDSTICRRKPLYICKAIAGSFLFKNLPPRPFQLYALHDLNKNLMYDLSGERIAFYTGIVNGTDSQVLSLYTFMETIPDSLTQKKSGKQTIKKTTESWAIKMNADTVNLDQRTFDITDTLRIQFDIPIKQIDLSAVRVYQDNILDATLTARWDTLTNTLLVYTQWAENMLYQVNLNKGGFHDSNGASSPAFTFRFRTKRSSDYGQLAVKIKPMAASYLELIHNDKIVARRSFADTMVRFSHLTPGNYQLRRWQDKNMNGKWDTGSLFPQRQEPEIMVLLPGNITIKANWENSLDLRLEEAPPKK